jgi:hypothetical protein
MYARGASYLTNDLGACAKLSRHARTVRWPAAIESPRRAACNDCRWLRSVDNVAIPSCKRQRYLSVPRYGQNDRRSLVKAWKRAGLLKSPH